MTERTETARLHREIDDLTRQARNLEHRVGRLTTDRDKWKRYARKWENKFKNQSDVDLGEHVGFFVPIITQRELDHIIHRRLSERRNPTSTNPTKGTTHVS